ncbi:Alkylphosphonate utilization operon protein PhnA [Paracholeplasma brassicae]|uniref:Alkylphosphonate utilization operon protein PhnA n=1 Tax=Acholeplasma brassicae TaxID=61635 RepID=U4KNE1_9MOLU|nr:zinc ribbon domain-containing protein YjdM [Paracholeplasma brassicae]CCV65766.1 Alkylphosphonate utilization operon protein PhnA [Paracholeplasma brassicae]
MSCPSCGFEYTYENGEMMVCSACQYEWDKNPEVFVLDANKNKLVDGDAVIVIKDLKVSGASNMLKQGTKVDKIKIQEGDHNIACRISGFGQMNLKSEFVKKA